MRSTHLQSVLLNRADDETHTILPAHTHTQPAQPVLLAHHLLAYVEMLDRDADRLSDAAGRADRSPAGSGAVAGSGLAIDRDRVAAALGFSGVTDNSIDAVSDRDYALESVAALAILLGHLSRLAGELVLWSTPYVGFVRLDDAFSSGSSMLPNKRNPDSAELVRARAARVEGDLVVLLSLVRGLAAGVSPRPPGDAKGDVRRGRLRSRVPGGDERRDRRRRLRSRADARRRRRAGTPAP